MDTKSRFSCKKKIALETEKKIRRFSKTETEKDAPFFKYYNPLPDPVLKQEKRKMKSTEYPVKKPKLKKNFKCCKDKKKKMLQNEEQKLQKCIEPLTKKQQRELEEKQKHKLVFVCKKQVIRLPSPVTLAAVPDEGQLEFTSVEKPIPGKVVPQKISVTDSYVKAIEPVIDTEQIKSKIPKSKIYINKTKKQSEKTKYPPVDSIDYIYSEKYRGRHPWYEMYRGQDHLSFYPKTPAPSRMPDGLDDDMGSDSDQDVCYILQEYDESEEESTEKPIEKMAMTMAAGDAESESALHEEKIMKSITRFGAERRVTDSTGDASNSIRKVTGNSTLKLKNSINSFNLDSADLRKDKSKVYDVEDFEGQAEDKIESFTSVSISKLSAATSIESNFKMKYPDDDQYDTGSLVPNVISRILQKYQRESEIELIKQEKIPYKKGTIKSHSTSKIPNIPKSFYFGVREGSMHYGDENFSEKSRFRQGLPICVAAYVMSFVIPPFKWKLKDIDFVLELGDQLYLKSLELMHLHETPRILQPEELCDIIELTDKKIKYRIDEPDIAGFTKSQDPRIYNLLKGLSLFFKRHRSGIFQTYNTNILIYRQKFFYVFDPEPRTKELYSNENGVSILATFYDLPSVIIMLLERGKLDNWPYIISKISIRKIARVTNKQDNISLSSEFREESLYKIVSPFKAVVQGAINIDDPCFGDTQGTQALSIAIIAIVYSHVTPACAWHKKTVDKIIMVANQFQMECLKDTNLTNLKIENVPAFFTLGPLMIEITIYVNQYAGLMYRKAFCLFEELLTKFFCHNNAVVVEIDKFTFAMWKHRDVFYTFDPYSRNKDGIRVKDGVACVSMCVNLDTAVRMILQNYTTRDFIFKLHAMKVIRVNRDPEFGQYPRSLINSETSVIESIKISDKRAFSPKIITIDKTETAAKVTDYEQELEPSILEVGSFVGSLDQKYVPNIAACPSKAVIKFTPPAEEKIIDLESPSLSDTQIERDRPSPLKTDSFEFKLLDEILKEEYELTRIMELGEGGDDDYLKLIADYDSQLEMQDEMVQKGKDTGLIDRKPALTNTDLMGLNAPIREVLEPNEPPNKRKAREIKPTPSPPKLPQLTQSKELSKPSNFVSLPDGSEILYGSKNIANIGELYEFAVPFTGIVAIIMARKYTLNTWTEEVVDCILDYGYSVYNTIEVNFSDAPKIDIPRLTIGSHSFHVVIDYTFDSLLAQSILEQSLEKLVFRNKESALVVTQNYSCAIFKKYFLYYMFDAYGNNLVGLGEGPDNTGVACVFRFKTLYAVVSRFLYNKKQRESLEPTEASRFIISSVDVNIIQTEEVTKIPRREKQIEGKRETRESVFESNPEEVDKEDKKQKAEELKGKNKTGYQKKGEYETIEGSDVLTGRNEGTGDIKPCYFVCICAMIGIFGRAIRTWDTKRIDYVVKMGQTLYNHADDTSFDDKRYISNLLFDRHIFDLVVKRLTVLDPKYANNFHSSLEILLNKNKFLLIQFPNCCYVLYKGCKQKFHLFDPYGYKVGDEEPKSCWIKFPCKRILMFYFKKYHKNNMDRFFFYTISLSHLKKASKKSRLEYKLRVTQIKRKKKQKAFKIFTESEEWLKEYPIPWSRMKKQLASGPSRGVASHRWFHWDVEYPGDLYSMISTNHQSSTDFSPRSRNKQTIANCIVAIIMTEIYNFTEWNPQILNSILNDGDTYFNDTFKNIHEENYQISVEDFPLNVNIFPYNINILIEPAIEGTMFILKPDQYNLSKALQYFFRKHENRCGIICCYNGRGKTKYLAFGRIREGEYFMFDSQMIGPPMFVDRFNSKAYILRCVTLNRLLHILTMTLRGGDFFIYEVSIDEEQGEREIMVQNLEEAENGEGT